MTISKDIARIRQVADVARFRGLTEHGRIEMRQIADRVEELWISLLGLAEKWDGETSRESFAPTFAAELREALVDYVFRDKK